MVPVLGCITGAVLLLVLAPWVLTMGRWQVRFPRTALTLWFSAFFAGCALMLGAVIAAILVSIGAARVPTAAEAISVTMAAWLSLGAVGAVLAFVSVSAEPLTASQRESVRRLAPVAVARERRPGFTLVWFDSEEPVACAVPGRSAEILVSTGLRRTLTGPQLRAVVAHEYAHLRYRHGWAVRIAEVNALCLPRRVQAGRGLKRATLLLVELMADDAAARQAGAAHLANALSQMAEAGEDVGMALRAERLTLRRWPRGDRRRLPEPIRGLRISRS